MITKISETLAQKLSEATGRTGQVDEMRYGFEILIGGAINPIILFAVAWILGIFDVCLWLTLTFAGFRIVMGGYHFVTYWRCLLVTLVSLLGASFLATALTFLSEGNMNLIIILTGAISILFSFAYVPANGRYMEMKVKQKKRLKKASIYLSVIWMVGMLILIRVDVAPTYVLASTFGLGIQLLTMPGQVMRVLSRFEANLKGGENDEIDFKMDT